MEVVRSTLSTAKKGTRYGQKWTLLFFVPRVAAPQVFCYLDETIGPKQERKERGPSVERRVCADPEGDL